MVTGSDDEGSRELPSPLVTLRRGEGAARQRNAPLARETSDVSRFHGLLAAGVVGALALFGAVLFGAGAAGLRSPGPLSGSHERAGLECRSCHAEKSVAKACSSCHGAHTSTRTGHQRLREAGTLGCPTCHDAHGGESLVFSPSGEVIRRRGSGEQTIEGLRSAFRPARATTIPVVRAGVCAGCHDVSSTRDPIARCFVRGQASLGAERPSLCFDEHREIASPGPGGAKVKGRPPERDAAWEAARETLAERPEPASRASLAAPLGWLGFGAFAAIAALVVDRQVRKRRARRLAREPLPVLKAAEVVRLPQIDPTTCLGCYACVDACPYDVLEVRRYVAVVARPDVCCGLTLCEQRCPNGSLVVRDGEPVADRPRVTAELEAEASPGVYLAGDLTGLPLIRNAINQGALAMRGIAASLAGAVRGSDPDVCDVVIAGAGPAGISAALEAKLHKLTFLVLEQGSVAESIRSFPREKLVFDQPLGMPLVGELWLDECTKEELLGKWLRVVRRERLPIEEGSRLVAITRLAGGPPLGTLELRVRTLGGEDRRIRTRRLLLSIGRRGSPRKLAAAIDDAMQDRVHYSLADARSFAGSRVVIVGLGDVAMETAIALARQPGTSVTMVHRGSEFRRGKARNIDELGRLVEGGRVTLLWRSEVGRIDAGRVVLAGPNGANSVDCDSVFVMIGSVPPWALLEEAGVGRTSPSA